MQAFGESGSQFFNYKGSHSIILLACVSAHYQFIFVDIGAEGRASDGGVLKNSSFGKALAAHQLNIPPPKQLPGCPSVLPFVFVPDEAFPLGEHIMRPYPGTPLGDDEIIFNYRLSRARMMVENSFGILSAKWRIYRRPILASLPTAKSIVKATVCLHNWLISEEDDLQPAERTYCSPRMPDAVDKDGNVVEGQWHNQVTDGDAIRDLPSTLRLGSNRYSHYAADIREK